jgi:hypothetical protein
MLQDQRRIGFGGNPAEGLNRVTPLARAVEEPVFLDEPLGAAYPKRVSETALAFEIFPDEDYGKDPVLRTESDRGPIRLFEVRKTPTEASVPRPPIGKIRPGMLLLFFVAAAFAAFGTVRACQVSGVSSIAIWQQPGP